MNQVTVKELLKYCQKQVKKGNGDKKIVISDDNEGNGFHGLFYGFSENVADFKDEISDSAETNTDNLVILG